MKEDGNWIIISGAIVIAILFAIGIYFLGTSKNECPTGFTCIKNAEPINNKEVYCPTDKLINGLERCGVVTVTDGIRYENIVSERCLFENDIHLNVLMLSQNGTEIPRCKND